MFLVDLAKSLKTAAQIDLLHFGKPNDATFTLIYGYCKLEL